MSEIKFPLHSKFVGEDGEISRPWLMWLQNPQVLSINIQSAIDVGSGGTGLTSTPAAGQLLIGTGTGYALNTLTASGISVTNSVGAINLGLNTFNSTDFGGVPASGGGTTNFLRADGSWAAPISAPASPTTAVQFNNGGVFGGDAGFTYTGTGTSGNLTVANLTGATSTSGANSPNFFLVAGAAAATQNGGTTRLFGATATGSGKAGGSLNLQGGASTAGTGGLLQFASGAGVTGGAVSITSGAGTTGASGNLTITTGVGATIGTLTIAGGQPSGSAPGGNLVFTGGASVTSAIGGNLTFNGGLSASGTGGSLTLTGGISNSYGANPASATFNGGLSTGAGSNINFQAGDAGLGSNANPGNITITTGLIDSFGGAGTSGGYFAVVNQNNPSTPFKIAVDATGLIDQIGFFGVTPIAKPTVTGSRATGVALQNLLTKLASLGLITDSTTV